MIEIVRILRRLRVIFHKQHGASKNNVLASFSSGQAPKAKKSVYRKYRAVYVVSAPMFQGDFGYVVWCALRIILSHVGLLHEAAFSS
jgi:hypothetical protein